MQVRRDLPGVSRGRAHPLPCRYVGTVAMPTRSAGEGRAAAPRRARHRVLPRWEVAHQGGRAPGRVEHWHGTCILSVQHPGSTAGGDAVVPVLAQGEADGLQGGSPSVPGDPAQGQQQMVAVLQNLAIMGGLLRLFAYGAGAFALGAA